MGNIPLKGEERVINVIVPYSSSLERGGYIIIILYSSPLEGRGEVRVIINYYLKVNTKREVLIIMYLVLFMAMTLSGLTIACGVYLLIKKDDSNLKRIRKLVKVSVAAYVILVAGFIFFFIPNVARAQSNSDSSSGMGFLAAALSTGLATIGAGYAVGAVGSSALGAVSEDPDVLGKTLIFVGLAEGIAIYGLIVSIMILGRL
ncbi:MAG: ATP synthase subunit c [Atribacteria bacterium 34_128]|nr:MAG: ATP synthase subunit c [Atribacteria bacterium 34_128]